MERLKDSNDQRNQIINFLIWLSITLFFCYQSVLRILPNIISQSVMSEFNISAAEFGSFAGLYYIGYISLHIPIGIALTKIGTKKIISLCIVITALGLIPLAYPINWNWAIVGRVLTGIGSSAAAVGGLQIFRIIYPEKFTRMFGLMIFFGLITAVYIGKPLASIVLNIGSNTTVNGLLFFGLVLAASTYVLIPTSEEELLKHNVVSDIKSVLFNSRLLFTAFFAGFMIGPMEGFADAWGSAFLISVYEIDKISADSMVLLILLGMSLGCIILPYITDKTGYYFGVTIASGIGMILSFWYLLTGDADVKLLDYLCIIIGIFCAYQVVILAKVATFVSQERSGIAGAVTNMIMMTFGWVFHSMIGVSLDNSWTGETIDGARYYSSDAFIESLSIIPNYLIIGVIGLFAVSTTIFIKARIVKKAQQ